jgi:hypothetical protein
MALMQSGQDRPGIPVSVTFQGVEVYTFVNAYLYF